MPAATDTILTTEAHLWAIVDAWTPLANIKPGNRIRYDQTTSTYGWPDKQIAAKQAGDVPMIWLNILDGRNDPRAARTFCLQAQQVIVTYEWTLLGPDKTYPVLTQALAELRACMNTAGVQLGIPAIVAKWEEEFRLEDAPPAVSGGTKRRQLKYRQRITIKG